MVSKALFLPHITKKVVPSWIPLYIFGMTIILFQQWKSAIVNWRREEICRYSCSKIHQTTRLRKNCDHITYTQYSHTPRFVALGHLALWFGCCNAQIIKNVSLKMFEQLLYEMFSFSWKIQGTHWNCCGIME